MRKQKIKTFWGSLGHAGRGLFFSWKTQQHLRYHGASTGIVLAVAYWLELARWEWVALILTIGSVIAAEVMNTALEVVVDLVEPDYHPMAGLAKDIAAAAVLVTAIQSVIIGVIILGPHLLRKLG